MKTLNPLALALIALALPAAAAHAAVQPYIADANTAALYHLDGNGNDASGNGLNLTPGASTSYTGSINNLGQAAANLVSGNHDLERLALTGGEVAAFNTQTFTIEAWVRNPSIVSGGDSMGIFQYRAGDSRVSLRLSAAFEMQLSYHRASDGGFDFVKSAAIDFEEDTWYHLAVTYSGDGVGNDSIVDFYVTPDWNTDGIANHFGTVTGVEDIKTLSAGGALRVGNLDNITGRSLGGDLDEVRYSNVVRTAFNVTAPTPAALPAGLALMGLVTLRRRSAALTTNRRK